MANCDACGKPLKGGIGMGGAMLCRPCYEDVRIEMDRLRSAGEPVNAMGIARRIFRETHSAGSYLLRDIPEELWNRAKHRAIDDGDSLRDLILKAVESYLKNLK